MVGDEGDHRSWLRRMRFYARRPADIFRAADDAKRYLTPRAANMFGAVFMIGLAVCIVLIVRVSPVVGGAVAFFWTLGVLCALAAYGQGRHGRDHPSP